MLHHAIALQQKGRLAEATALYVRILEKNPEHARALHLLGLVHAQSNRLSVALELMDRAIRNEPNNPAFFCDRGIVLQGLKRFDDALRSFARALVIRPNFPEALNNRGNTLMELGRFDDALASYDRALALNTGYADALNNRGNVLRELNRLHDALASYDRALAALPGFGEAWNNRGNVLHDLKRFDEALVSYDRALDVLPDRADILNNRGSTLAKLTRFSDALACFERALILKPDYAEALNGRANVLRELRRFDEALASCDRALAVWPHFAEALNNQGAILQHLGRFDEALTSFGDALAIKPDFVDALVNRGSLLGMLKRVAEAACDVDQVLRIDPDREYALGDLLHLRMRACDWGDLDALKDAVEAGVREGKRVCRPFGFQAISSSPEDLQACSRIFAGHACPSPTIWRSSHQSQRRDKIRLGYVSGEFREQATSYLIAGLFELHDRNRFDVYAFDNGYSDRSAMRRRLEAGFDALIDISRLSDKAAASLIQEHGVDILMNLNGYFGLERTGIFALRPAPVQVNYLGFPATLGSHSFDYIVADRIVIPKSELHYYDEKIVYLPDTYQVNDRNRAIADTRFSRTECDLPEEGFVFCCFSNNYKITPEIFDVWMRLLHSVEGSVLWLLEDNSAVAANLCAEARARKIAPERLVFAKRMALSEHLARHRVADLFLDTLPYNAHTTASDALWAGLPILTCLGNTFPGRVASSLLTAVGLPELIARTLHEYEDVARRLATSPHELALLKQKLEANRLAYPLFDTARFARHIEAAYVSIWERHRSGIAPEHIDILAQGAGSEASCT